MVLLLASKLVACTLKKQSQRFSKTIKINNNFYTGASKACLLLYQYPAYSTFSCFICYQQYIGAA